MIKYDREKMTRPSSDIRPSPIVLSTRYMTRSLLDRSKGHQNGELVKILPYSGSDNWRNAFRWRHECYFFPIKQYKYLKAKTYKSLLKVKKNHVNIFLINREIEARKKIIIEDVKKTTAHFQYQGQFYVVFHGHFEKKIAFGTNWNQSSSRSRTS